MPRKNTAAKVAAAKLQICPKCSLEIEAGFVAKGIDTVACDVCEKRYHSKCIGLEPSTVKNLNDAGHVICCTDCKAGCKKLLSTVSQLQATVRDLLESSKELKERLSKVESRNDSLENGEDFSISARLENLERNIQERTICPEVISYAGAVKKTAGGITVSPAYQITKIINERESKKKNVIISGVLESPDEEVIDTVKEIFEKINIPVHPTMAKRIGKQRDGAARKILVQLPGEEVVKDIMRKKSKLREAPEDWMRSVYINEDLSQEQREFLSSLYDEAASKNSKMTEDSKYVYVVAGRRSSPFLKKITSQSVAGIFAKDSSEKNSK